MHITKKEEGELPQHRDVCPTNVTEMYPVAALSVSIIDTVDSVQCVMIWILFTDPPIDKAHCTSKVLSVEISPYML